MGFSMFFGVVMGPLIPRLSDEARRELILKLFPRINRYALTFATLSLIFGAILF